MLIRFRADPKKVRVSIRKVDVAYIVSITSVVDGCGECIVQESAIIPRAAILRALKSADKLGMQGIDTGMQWAYDHPQYPRES